MIRLKHILVPFVFAVVVSSIQFWVAIRLSTAILWQVTLMHYLVGPGPILGYGNGQPMYEGTPVHMAAALVGLGLGVIVYWLVGYFATKKWHNHRVQWIAKIPAPADPRRWASRAMYKGLVIILILTSAIAEASEVQISLFDKRTSEQTNYSLDVRQFKLRQIESVNGVELPQIDQYTSQNRKLVGNSNTLTDADEVLFQCQVDGVDLIVVRGEYNSFLGPLNFLAAVSGHPVQVSRIIVLTITNNKVMVPRYYVWVTERSSFPAMR